MSVPQEARGDVQRAISNRIILQGNFDDALERSRPIRKTRQPPFLSTAPRAARALRRVPSVHEARRRPDGRALMNLTRLAPSTK